MTVHSSYICLVCLVIPSDYSGQLTYLLHYPSLPPPPTSDFDSSPHHASLLLRQALALQMSPTPSTGVSVVVENRNLLNIPMEVPDPPPPPTRRRAGHSARDKSASASEVRPGGEQSGSSAVHSRQQSSQMGLPEMIARGLLDRGESLGINKTVMNAVSELRVSSYLGMNNLPFDSYVYHPQSEIYLN